MKLRQMRESDQRIFHPLTKYLLMILYQLLMDPGHLTATGSVLLMFSKLKDFLKHLFSNIAVPRNHLRSVNNAAA